MAQGAVPTIREGWYYKVTSRYNRAMGYRNLRECLEDLERTGQLVRIDQEVDGDLEVAEIQRRVYAAAGPAVYYLSLIHI